MRRILILEPEKEVRERICRCLTNAGHSVDAYPCAAHVNIQETMKPDVVLVDWSQPSGQSGVNWVLGMRDEWPDVPVVVLCADPIPSEVHQTTRQARIPDVLKWTATDARILDLVARVIDPSVTSPSLRKLRTPAMRLVGESRVWQTVLRQVAEALDGPPNRSLLLLGSRGTGKSQLASAIGTLRHSGQYKAENVANLSDQLFESLVFGHEKGAYTDAKERRIGLVEAVGHGVLFLDEIGNLSLSQQAKLLTFVQTREYSRLGANTTQRFEGRLVFGTNADLETDAQQGRFRHDLLDRLRDYGSVIQLPTLVDRKADIVPLFRYYLTEAAAKKSMPISLDVDADVVELLLQAPYPGNVRQLQGYAEKAAMKCLHENRNVIECGDLPDQFYEQLPRGTPSGATLTEMLIDLFSDVKWPEALYDLPYMWDSRKSMPPPETVMRTFLDAFVITFGKTYFERLHNRHRTQRSMLAAAGMSDKTLRDLLRQAGLERLLPRRDDDAS